MLSGPHTAKLHTSTILLASKKNSKSKKSQKQQKIQIEDDKIQAEAEEEVVTPTIDFKDATSRFESILAKFEKLANEIKLGKLNPKIFDIFDNSGILDILLKGFRSSVLPQNPGSHSDSPLLRSLMLLLLPRFPTLFMLDLKDNGNLEDAW